MILTGKNINERVINQQVGKPIVFKLQKLRVKGSSGLFLKSFLNKKDNAQTLPIDSKCNIEKRKNGIVVYSNYLNKINAILIPETEIIEIVITRGKEVIDPFIFSPMWLLLKLKVSILYARYFRYRLHEYSIQQMELEIKTTKYEIKFVANGYLFETQQKFLMSLGYNSKFKIITDNEN